ncbi:MAG: hypothetical protein QXW41_08150 [Fervidicoccaceae archaeon]
MVRAFFESELEHVLTFRKESVRVAFAVSKCLDVDTIARKVCPFCGRRFKTRVSMLSHMYAHVEFSRLIECVKGVLSSW